MLNSQLLNARFGKSYFGLRIVFRNIINHKYRQSLRQEDGQIDSGYFSHPEKPTNFPSNTSPKNNYGKKIYLEKIEVILFAYSSPGSRILWNR